MIPLFKPFMSDDAIKNTVSTLSSGKLTQGEQVELFEKKLSDFFHNPYVCTLNSGTSALFLALKICNLKPSDEVLTSPLTCFASTSAILANNYNIKWIDIDKSDCNISLDDLEQKITEKTKVILYVLWAGTPIDLKKLYSIKKNAELKFNTKITIIQDCAHAFGSTYNTNPIGYFSEDFPSITCYSFQAIKHLTTGDGGAILLPNKELYERVKLLRWYGINRDDKMLSSRIEQNIIESGYKMHMNDINASIGLGNLKYAIENVENNKNIAKLYYKHLQNLKHVKLLPYNNNSSYWIYTLYVQDLSSFSSFMKSKNICVNQVHTRNDTHDCVIKFSTNDLPNVSFASKHFISIPCGSWWLTEKDVYYIIDSIKEWNNKNN